MFQEVVFKLIKWSIAMSFLILGIYTLQLASLNYDIRPFGLTILSLGFVVWMSKSTFEASKKIFITGMGTVVVSWVFTHFIGQYLLYDMWQLEYFMSWEVTMLMLGIPVMAFTFLKE